MAIHPLQSPSPVEAPEDAQVGPAVAPPLGRGMRIRAPPKIYQDFLAPSSIPFDIPMSGSAMVTPPTSPSPGPSQNPLSAVAGERLTVLEDSAWKETRSNGFGLYKRYWTLETRPHDPDQFLTHSDLREDEDDRLASLPHNRTPSANTSISYYPYPNWSSFKMGEWFWSEGDKSRESFQQLIRIICDEDFSPADLRQANWTKINATLAASEFDDAFGYEETPWAEDGMSWKTTNVTIQVPFNSTSRQPGPKPFTIADYRFRPLIPLIRTRLKDARAIEHFHFTPAELWWRPPDAKAPIRVHGDLYHSDAFLDAYREVQVSFYGIDCSPHRDLDAD